MKLKLLSMEAGEAAGQVERISGFGRSSGHGTSKTCATRAAANGGVPPWLQYLSKKKLFKIAA